MTNEHLVKWFLLEDAIFMYWTDGAVVRVTTPIAPGESWTAGDAGIRGFMGTRRNRLAG